MCCHLRNKTTRKPSGKPLTSRRMSNPLPSAKQNGAQTMVKAFDERKYLQYPVIR